MNIKQTTMLFVLLTLITAQNITPAASAPVATGSINIVTIKGQKVMTDSDAGKAIQKKLEAEQQKLAAPLQTEEKKVAEKEKDLLKNKETLDKEFSDFQKKSSLLNDDAKESQMEEFQARGRLIEEGKLELERMVRRLQSEAKRLEGKMQQMYQKEMGDFDNMVKEVIQDLSKKNSWDLVLMEESVVFASTKVNQDKTVIDELNKRHKAAKSAKQSTLKRVETDFKKDVEKLEQAI